MMHPNKKYEEVSDIELNPMDKSSLSNLILGYTPVDNITSSIMQSVSSDHLPDGTVVFLKKIDFITTYVVIKCYLYNICCMCLCECTYMSVQVSMEARRALKIPWS